jgi:decaprenyl-phosphate phosphoribosyltransferase
MNNTSTKYSAVERFIGLVKLIRLKQWVKNGFVFAPLIFSGMLLNSDAVSHALLAALLFCLASSATYIVNDLSDIEADRCHPKKSKSRPIASGVVSKNSALTLLALLYFVLVCGYFLMPKVILVISAYLILNLAYTFFLKHEPVIDIFTIAFGFVLRVIAGAVALNLAPSVWMCVTTLCLALYLAAVKRRQELVQSGTDCRKVLANYSVSLVDRYAEMSATGALLFYSMFVISTRPELAITTPLVLYGLFRYWYVVEVRDGGESPTDALLADWQLMLVIILWVAACMWALSGAAV